MLLETPNGVDLIQIIYVWIVMHDTMCLEQICLPNYILLYIKIPLPVFNIHLLYGKSGAPEVC